MSIRSCGRATLERSQVQLFGIAFAVDHPDLGGFVRASVEGSLEGVARQIKWRMETGRGWTYVRPTGYSARIANLGPDGGGFVRHDGP